LTMNHEKVYVGKKGTKESLDDFHHKAPLSKEVFKAIKPIYEELSQDELLNCCLRGYTQNSNESFMQSSGIWLQNLIQVVKKS